MKRTHKFVAVTLATLSIVATSAVLAFPGPGMGMGPGFGPMGGMPGGFGPGGRMAGGDPASMIDARMNQLKADLKITPAQEPAWQAFTGKVKEQAQAMLAMRNKMQETADAAPDRMAQRTEFMKQRIGNMEAMTTSLKDLYAVLTPEQKATADQSFGHMGGRRMAFGPQGR